MKVQKKKIAAVGEETCVGNWSLENGGCVGKRKSVLSQIFNRLVVQEATRVQNK
jgi:hypothetical protein